MVIYVTLLNVLKNLEYLMLIYVMAQNFTVINSKSCRPLLCLIIFSILILEIMLAVVMFNHFISIYFGN